VVRGPRRRREPARGPALLEQTAARILRIASEQLFTHGYQALTMDGLAHGLGISKKTLYAHFAGKDEIITAIIDAAGLTIRAEVETVIGNEALSFTAKLRDVMAIIGAQWGRLTPALLRELERFAPPLLERLQALRQRNIPLVLGRMLRLGMAQGMVRPDLDADFAVQFWLQSLNGLVQPSTLAQLDLTPREAFENGVRLFFWAVLSELGRADFAPSSPRQSSLRPSSPRHSSQPRSSQ
jgi:AcrR family transcriptional regulator